MSAGEAARAQLPPQPYHLFTLFLSVLSRCFLRANHHSAMPVFRRPIVLAGDSQGYIKTGLSKRRRLSSSDVDPEDASQALQIELQSDATLKKNNSDAEHLSDFESRDSGSSSEDDEDDRAESIARRRARPTHNARHQDLQRQHLDVLNAILHKSLMHADHERASRAFAMLLRYRIANRGMDLRRPSIWGTAVHILLNRPSTSRESSQSSLPFSESGLADALTFLKGLAVAVTRRQPENQYVSEVQITTYALSLEIFQLQAKVNESLSNDMSVDEESGSSSSDGSTSDSSDAEGLGRNTASRPHAPSHRIPAAQVAEIRALADRIEERVVASEHKHDGHVEGLWSNYRTWMGRLGVARA